jgi:L,D-transpeptidase-like protein
MSSKGFSLAVLLLIHATSLSGQTPTSEPPVGDQLYQLVEGGLRKEELRRLDPDLLALLEKLNRADVSRLGRLPVVVIPASETVDELQHSPLPLTYGWASGLPKALVVDLPSQVFGAYENGSLVRWGPISSGTSADPTPSGLFYLNWNSRGRFSSIDPDWYMRWYFNFHAGRGLAFHQHPLPGLPASHACIRLLERDAKWLYQWGEGWQRDERGRRLPDSGTPVLILGQYDYDAPPPWRSLEWLAAGVKLPEDAPLPYRQTSQTAK